MIVGVVVTYNSQQSINECLTSALESGVEKVLLWDNSPTPETRDAVAQKDYQGRVEILGNQGNLGFGEANNRALEQVEDQDTVILINPDCIVNADCIRELVSATRTEGVGLVAPRMRYEDGSFGYSGGARPRLLKELLALTEVDEILPSRVRSRIVDILTSRRGAPSYTSSTMAGEPLEVDWVSGFCIGAIAGVLRRVGGFDSDFFLYFEDVDLSLRVKSLGLTNFIVRDVSALHYESTSMTRHRKSKQYTRGMWTYFLKHGSFLERNIAKPFAKSKRKLLK